MPFDCDLKCLISSKSIESYKHRLVFGGQCGFSCLKFLVCLANFPLDARLFNDVVDDALNRSAHAFKCTAIERDLRVDVDAVNVDIGDARRDFVF